MKKYEELEQELRSRVLSGEYAAGQRLPTEQEMTEMFGVSRQTVRRALSELSEQGLITKRRGSGSTATGRTAPKTGRIAVVATYISDYIFPSQLRAVEEVLSENRLTAVLSATRNRLCNERAILKELLSDPVDGVLIEGTKTALPNPNANLYRQLISSGVPVVFFNGCPALEGAYSVCADNSGGGRMLARFLLEKGHRHIAGCFKSDDIQGHERYSGFISQLYASGAEIPDESVLWYTTETKDALFGDPQSVRGWLEGSTAVVCYNDEAAFALERSLLSAGVRIPADAAVVGFDDSALSRIAPVPLTTLSCENIGRKAAQKLVDILHGKSVDSEVVPWALVEREST